MKEIMIFGMEISNLVVVSSLVLGAIVILVAFIISQRRTNSLKHEECEVHDTEITSSLTGSTSEAGVNSGSGAGGSKRAKNKKRREAQQEFTHSWMVGALKGHTGSVLDMNFSSNGKFLASCAEDCGMAPEEELDGAVDHTGGSTTTQKEMSKSSCDNSKQADGNQTSSNRAILSRRQRKNRTRASRRDQDDDNYDEATPHHRLHQQQQQQQQQIDCIFLQTNKGLNSTNLTPRSKKNQQLQQQNNQKNPKIIQNNLMNNRNLSSAISPNSKKIEKNLKNIVVKYSAERKELKHLSDTTLVNLLRKYVIHDSDLQYWGYPVMHSPEYVTIYHHQHNPMGHRLYQYHQNIQLQQQQQEQQQQQQQQQHSLDVNAQEFIPGNNNAGYSSGESDADSGNGSVSSQENEDLEPESSSESDKNSDIIESSSVSSSSSSSSSDCSENIRRDSRSSPEYWGNHDPTLLHAVEHPCARCYKPFYIHRDTGNYITEEECIYHWGKFRNGHHAGEDGWECCRGSENSTGCTKARLHVWTGLVNGCNGPLDGYISTRPSRIYRNDRNYGVYALDCEMCFTQRGLELAKVTVVGIDGTVVYDTLVKPDSEIIDYNTRFSGITESDLKTVNKTLKDVQHDLISFIFAETILLGHGLENDLKALKILHKTVVDTCTAFPHHWGPPFRSSLKFLARTVLRKEIQVSEHDSVEDAQIVVDLMLRRIQIDIS